MKVLAIVGDSPTGESFIKWSNLDGWHAISKKVGELHLVLFTKSQKSHLRLSDKMVLHTVPVPLLFSKNPLLRVVHATVHTIILAAKIKCDIVLFLTGSMYIFSSVLSRVLLFKPVVVVVLGDDFELRVERLKLKHSPTLGNLASRALNLLELMCIIWSSRAVCVGINPAKRLLIYGVPRSKIRVVFNGVDVNKFKPRKEPLETENISLLYAGRLSWEKRIHVIIDAFKLLKKMRVPNMKLMIVGDGIQKSFLTFYSRGFEDISFINRKPHNEMPDIISGCDIVVLTSISEGLPSVVLEAMACGKAVICTPVGDIPYVIKDGLNGFLLRRGDSIELAEKINMLISHKEYCQRVGINARKTVEKVFNWDVIAERYYRCFREILAKD